MSEPEPLNGLDKLDAAVMAVCFMIFGLAALVIGGTAVVVIWKSGFFNALVIVGIAAGFFAIGRAIYHTILKKDFL